jgi:hypothetical protein
MKKGFLQRKDTTKNHFSVISGGEAHTVLLCEVRYSILFQYPSNIFFNIIVPINTQIIIIGIP